MTEEDKGGFLGQIAKFFKPKGEEQSAIVKGKVSEQKSAIAKRKSDIGRSVDGMLQGTGLFGAMLAPAMKAVGGMMAEAIEQQGEDMTLVLDELDVTLQRDSRVAKSLGARVAASTPIMQTYSSMSVNGKTTKIVNLVVPVSGSAGTGTAQVQAAIDGKGTLTDLQVLFSGPGVRQIQLSRAPSWSGDSDSDIIDVQPL